MSAPDDVAARVAAIRERAEKATPGPWLTDARVPGVVVFTQNLHHEYAIASCSRDRAKEIAGAREGYDEPTPFVDADFIAAAREDVPFLCDALEAALRERDEALRRETNAAKALAEWVRGQEAEDDALERRAEAALAEPESPT